MRPPSILNNGNDGVQNGGSVSATIYFQAVVRTSFPGPASTISGNRFEDNFGTDILLAWSNDVHGPGFRLAKECNDPFAFSKPLLGIQQKNVDWALPWRAAVGSRFRRRK